MLFGQKKKKKKHFQQGNELIKSGSDLLKPEHDFLSTSNAFYGIFAQERLLNKSFETTKMT